MHGPHCEGCPLAGKAEAIPPRGASDARFFVVTDSPSAKPESYGRLLSSSAMTIFARNMREQGFEKEDFVFYPQVRCVYDKDQFTNKEKNAIAKFCRPYLVEEVNKRNPDVVIPLGGEAASQVFGRAVKITKSRGVASRLPDFRSPIILPTLNPSMAAMYPQHEATIRSDCATLGRLVDSGYDIRKANSGMLGEYEFIDDLGFLLKEKPSIIAYDTETTDTSWFAPGATILTMQFCIEPGKAYMLPWDHKDAKRTLRQKSRLREQLIRLLCDPKRKVIGQNAKFDALFTYAVTGVRYRIGGDTQMLATLIDENVYGNSQADLVKRYVPDMAGYSDVFDAEIDKSKMADLPLDQKFLDYGCGDADSLLRLHEVLYSEVAKDKKLLCHYENVSIPGLNAFTSLDLRGLHVDEAAVDEFEKVVEEELAGMKSSLLKQVPASIKRAHVDKGLKFSRADFLLDILFRHKDGFRLKPKVFTKTTARLPPEKRVPSTSSKDHLPYFFDECPFTYELAEYIKLSRLLGTNIKGFKKKYIVDGMVRPTYRLDVTVTGRTSSENPNGQNIPKRGKRAKAYRKIFVAPPGYFFLEADYSQAELRIAADMANDPTLLRLYREGKDVHIATVLDVLGISREQYYSDSKDQQTLWRTQAKAVNFGLIYGMWYKKLQAYAKTQYGADFTEAESKKYWGNFFAKYYNLEPWHKKTKQFARENGYVRSYSGRIRHLPTIYSENEFIVQEAERQAVNSPVQEFPSTLGVMASSRIDEGIEHECLAIVAFVHDAIYSYVKCEYLEWGAQILRHYMESIPIKKIFGVELKVPMVADVSFGVNMGEMYELPGIPSSSTPSIGRYDFGAVLGEDSASRIIIPKQKIPPNNGKNLIGIYTTIE